MEQNSDVQLSWSLKPLVPLLQTPDWQDRAHLAELLQSRFSVYLEVSSGSILCHMCNAGPEFDVPIRRPLLSESGSSQWRIGSHSKIKANNITMQTLDAMGSRVEQD